MKNDEPQMIAAANSMGLASRCMSLSFIVSLSFTTGGAGVIIFWKERCPALEKLPRSFGARHFESIGDCPRGTLVKGLFARCWRLERLFSARSTCSTRLKSTPKISAYSASLKNELPLSHTRNELWYNVCR